MDDSQSLDNKSDSDDTISDEDLLAALEDETSII